jgi:vancomycin resistance protein YoaR
VNDEILRGGWWNDTAQREYRAGKTLWDAENLTDVWKYLKTLEREVYVKPQEGNIVFHPIAGGTGGIISEEKFTVEGGICGRSLDTKKLRYDIKKALATKKHQEIVATVREVPPPNAEEIIDKIGLRGNYTTYFESNPNREHNIALALSKFNGLVIENGQSVSFNKVVGKRTEERGFQEAKIILDGEFVPGIGGGVCQASTTLFNAVMASGMTIDKSSNHSLAISYVPIGRDAMVSSGTDLCFTNNTGTTMYFEAGTTDANENHYGAAWVKIYGKKTPVKFKPRTQTTEMELNDGEIDPARKSITYVDTYRGDQIVHTKLIRKSNYQAVREKDKPEPENPTLTNL